MNKAGRRVRVLRGDKLPESTGDELPGGDMDSNIPGEIFRLDSPGEIFEIYWGSGSAECLVYRWGKS